MESRVGNRSFAAAARPLVEIAAVLALPLAVMWVTPLLFEDKALRDWVDASLSAGTLLIAAGLCLLARDGPAELGFRMDNFRSAAALVSRFTLLSALILLATGWLLGTLRFGPRFWFQLAVLPLWGLQQQFGMQSVIHRRYQAVFGAGRASVLLTALTFSCLHIPNPVLVAATFVAGWVWSSAFRRRPNLPALALSHGLLSTLLANSLPQSLLPNMKVGLGFWN